MSNLDQTLSETAVEPSSRPPRSPAEAAEASVSFGHFAIARREDGSLHELGRGAMGVTYKAFDTQLGSHVALKVISPSYLHDRGARERFLREARAAAHLNHPNVASVFHLGSDGDTVFYAMQFIEGETLESLVKRRGPLPVRLALRIILQAAQGLAAASDRGLIHRDIKPANLMLTHARGADDGEDDDLLVKVIDFGLAKTLAQDETAAESAQHVSLTGGGPIGTPYFMSPEQIDGSGAMPIDARTDIYSLGVTLWYLLLGSPPFGGTQFQVFSQHMSKTPPLERLTDSGVPAGVIALIGRTLAKEPDDRPANHRELIGALKRLLREEPSFDNNSSSASATLLPPAAGFPVLEVLRRRGALPPRDAFLLLRPIAGFIDDALLSLPVGARPALTAENLRVEFAEPPTNRRELPARSPETWPPFSVALAARDMTGSADLDRTVLPASSSADGRGAPLLCQLGALAYELLNGAPPSRGGYVPITVLSEAGNALLRQCLEGASGATDAGFPTATEFVQALSEGTVRGGGAAGIASRSSALVPVPMATFPQQRPQSPAISVATQPFHVIETASGSGWITRLVVLAVLAASGYAFRKPIADFVNAKFRTPTSATAAATPSRGASTPAKAAANSVALSAPRPQAPAPTPVIVYVPAPQPQQQQQQQQQQPPPPMNAGGMMMMPPPPPPFPGGMPPPPPGGRPGNGPPPRR